MDDHRDAYATEMLFAPTSHNEDGPGYLVGWLDGATAAREAIIGTFNREAARFLRVADREGVVRILTESNPEPEAATISSELSGDPERDRGFAEGWRVTAARLASKLRDAVLNDGLFVANDGHVATIAVASEMVSRFRRARVPANPTPTEDQPISRKLNVPETSFMLAPVSVPLAGRSAPARVTRRALISAGAGVLVAGVGVLSWFGLGAVKARANPSPLGQAAGTYRPPNHWDHLPAPVRDFYLAWDQLVWGLEQSPNGKAAFRQSLQAVMESPNRDELKVNMAGFLADSGRTEYTLEILHALLPGRSHEQTHASIIGVLALQVQGAGADNFDPASIQALLMYRNTNLAPASVVPALNLLLERLGH